MKKLFKITAILVCLLTILTGCGSSNDSQKDPVEKREEKDELVEYNNGSNVTIKMPKDMKEDKLDGYIMFYCNDYFMFEILEESDQGMVDAGLTEDVLNIDEYIDILNSVNQILFEKDASGNYFVTYEANVDGDDFAYYSTVRRGSEAFYLCTFACLKADQETYLPLFEDYAKTITVK